MNLVIPKPRVLILAVLVVFTAYWLLMPHDVPDYVAVSAQIARATVALMVSVVYGYSILQMWRQQPGTEAHALVIGIWIAFTADFVGAAIGVAWRYEGRPPDWASMNFWLFPSFMTTLAAMLHVAVPGAIDGKIPRRNIIWIGLSFAVAGLVAGLAIASALPPGSLDWLRFAGRPG
jgi:hypothetical protein